MIIRIHGVSIGIPVDSCYKLVDKHVKELGLVDVNAHDIVDLIGYTGLGYGRSSQQEMGKHLYHQEYILYTLDITDRILTVAKSNIAR
jgi:hypothetical protein